MKSLVDGGITEASAREARRLVAESGCGGGVYTTLGVRDGRPLHLEAHIDRLRREAARASVRPLPVSTLRSAVATVLRSNRARDCVIRLGWLARAGVRGPFALCEPPRRTPVKIVLQVIRATGPPLGGYAKSHHQFRWHSLRDQAQQAGVFDVLVLREGWLTETSRFNVLLELGGRLCTPPDSEVFCGIARGALLSDPHKDTQVRPLSWTDLLAATRVLLINSVRGALEVAQVLDSGGDSLWQRKARRAPRTPAQLVPG